jgi:hypothetical protein
VQEDVTISSQGLSRYFHEFPFIILVQEDVTISSQGLARYFHEFHHP